MLFKWMLFIHRWFGITVGLFFVLLGLSGSYIVYKETFQEWLGSEVRHSSGSSGAVSFVQAVQSAQKGLGIKVPPTSVSWSGDSLRNIELVFTGLPGMGRAGITAFVDPATGTLKGTESFPETISGKIFFFHHDIFLGSVGRTIMAVSGLAMLFLLLGGLYLWWPRAKTWRRVLKLGPMNNALQTNLQLHKFFGFYTILLMLMVTFSGIYISKPNWFQGGSSFERGPGRDRKGSERGGRSEGRSEDADASEVDLQKLGAFVEAQPKPLSVRIDLNKKTLQVRSGDTKTKLLSLETFKEIEADATKPKDMRGIQRELHGGHFWSVFGKALVFISGLLPLFFYVSGIYIWWKKSKIRRAKNKKAAYV